MSYTQLFDDTNNLFDPVVFDTIKRYSASITEKQTVFDSAVFDSVVFDTAGGGIVTVADSVERLMATYRTLSESESVSDSIARQLASFRTISEATVSVGVGAISRILGIFRTITGVSITTSDSVATISPTSNRYIYDLGSVFDDIYFSSPPFDIDVKSYVITDSVSRLFASYRTITGVSISISDSISRVFGAIRSLSESVSTSDSVSRLMAALDPYQNLQFRLVIVCQEY